MNNKPKKSIYIYVLLLFHGCRLEFGGDVEFVGVGTTQHVLNGKIFSIIIYHA